MQTVTEIAYHRNGIGGDGFYVARVNDTDQGRTLVAIVPAWAVGDEDTDRANSPGGGVPCFVIDPAVAAGETGTIAFGENSWRGDNYFDVVVTAAREYQKR